MAVQPNAQQSKTGTQQLEDVAQEIVEAKGLLQTAAPGEEKVAVLNYLSQLQAKKVLLMQQQQSGASTTPKVPGSSSGPKMITIFFPAGIFTDITEPEVLTPSVVTFDDQADFKDYLRDGQYTGLFLVSSADDAADPLAQQTDALNTSVLVRKFDHLQSGAYYVVGPTSKETLKNLRQYVTHLGQRREAEFGEALQKLLTQQEPAEGYVNRDDLRVLHDSSGIEREIDAVVIGRSKAWIGSHKTYCDSSTPVKDIAQRAAQLEKLAAQPTDPRLQQLGGRKVCAAFMAERVKPEALAGVESACAQKHVMRLRRSGNSIIKARMVCAASACGRGMLKFGC